MLACDCLQLRGVRHNANSAPYARANARLSSLLYSFRESLASLSIAMGNRDSARDIRCLVYLDCDVCWFARTLRRTCVVLLVFRQHVEINVNATVFRFFLSLSNYCMQHNSNIDVYIICVKVVTVSNYSSL